MEQILKQNIYNLQHQLASMTRRVRELILIKHLATLIVEQQGILKQTTCPIDTITESVKLDKLVANLATQLNQDSLKD